MNGSHQVFLFLDILGPRVASNFSISFSNFCTVRPKILQIFSYSTLLPALHELERSHVKPFRQFKVDDCILSQKNTMSTFEIVPDKVNFPKNEEKILELWNAGKFFQKSSELAKGRPTFSFYDGPPFATGLPHYGHLLAGTIKDVVTRYAYQTGHAVSRRFGWDCHGLPIEYEIDKELNITTREDVLKMGIKEYNEKCRSIVMRYSKQWQVVVERMGRWIDFENDYKTMHLSFMESVWWIFQQLYDKGMVYRAFRVMPYSTACSTPLSNFEANLNYKDVSDPSIIVSFPLVEDASLELLAWTTTPWTLPSNLALCVHPAMMYVKFRCLLTNKIWIIAESRLEWFCHELKIKDEDSITLLECIPGQQLEGLRYLPLFDYFDKPSYSYHTTAFRVVTDTFVTDDAGTGIVHCAPAFGEEDYRLCVEKEIVLRDQLPCPVDENGHFTAEITDFASVYVKTADKAIKSTLKARQRLIVANEIVHSYPHCWRSETPLLYKAVPSWFIRVEALREKLLKNNAETYWVPSFVKEKRFYNWLAEAKDWCFSRNRFWGTPIPLWISEDGTHIRCIGSVKELQAYTTEPLVDIHRHFIDSISIPDPRGESYPPLKRIDEVFDCWFESGSMPYAQLHYPFENQTLFEESFPANFIAEGLDQTRGWFYTLMVLSTALFDKPAFSNLIVNGLILAADGKKMSKRLKNFPSPQLIIENYGADALRLYLVNSPAVRAEPLRFKEEGVKEVVKDILLPWYHGYRFFIQEVGRFETSTGQTFQLSKNVSSTDENVMDLWINSVTQQLIKFVREEMAAYRLFTVAPKLVQYLNQLTNWYVRLNRDRMRGVYGQEDSHISLSTMFDVLLTITRLMAPLTPFICEFFYQNLKKILDLEDPACHESIHFVMLPIPNENLIDETIELRVEYMQKVINMGRILRERKKYSLKTPLKALTILHPNSEITKNLQILETYIKEELNVLDIHFSNDMSNIRMAALPNFKTLGARLGSDMKFVHQAVKVFSQEIIAAYIETGKVEVEGHWLTGEDLIIQRQPMNQSNPNILVESDNSISILLDFSSDAELQKLALARELANRIQKLRKQFNFNPMDQLDIWILSHDKMIDALMVSMPEYIQKYLRKPLYKMDETMKEFISFPLLKKGIVEINGKFSEIYFTGKGLYFNKTVLEDLREDVKMKNGLLKLDDASIQAAYVDGTSTIEVSAEDGNVIRLKRGLHFATHPDDVKDWRISLENNSLTGVS